MAKKNVGDIRDEEALQENQEVPECVLDTCFPSLLKLVAHQKLKLFIVEVEYYIRMQVDFCLELLADKFTVNHADIS